MFIPQLANTYGATSILLWSMTAILAVSLNRIPAFEALAIISTFGFITCFLMNSYQNNWKKIWDHSKFIIIATVIGIIGNDCFYLLSFRYAPPLHVDLICFLWPIAFLITQWFANKKINYQELAAVLIAFLGIAIMLLYDNKTNYSPTYLIGYSMSFLSVAFWIGYLYQSKKYGKAIHELFAVITFCATLCFFITHCLFEDFVTPTLSETVFMFIIGSGGHCLAYIMWDYAVKFGNTGFISILTYAAPILSTLGLIYFGHAQASTGFYIAITCLIGAIKVIQRPRTSIAG